MTRKSILQDFVVPICEYEERDGSAHLLAFKGTAFFINEAGHYLTARHVIESCISAETKKYGLVVKHPETADNLIAPLRVYEHAPQPYDITIGKVDFTSKSWFTWRDSAVGVEWLDVATYGYPESALNVSIEYFAINLRTFKGYVIRPLQAGALPGRPDLPEAYELNFAIPQGMSGSPLFTPGGASDQLLLGICTNNHTSEVVEYVSEEVEADGAIYKEKRLRAEQYGIALQLAPLCDWKPAVLKGLSLRNTLVKSADA